MWRVLRAELVYFRSYLLVAWSISFGVAVIVNLLTLLAEDDHPGTVVAAGLPAIFFVIAAMVIGFVAQGTRAEERRARLLLAGPVTPRQLGAVLVLLPASLIGLGVLAGGLMVALASILTGQIELTPVRMMGRVTGQMFAIALLGPLAQESTAALRQGRRRVAIAGWIGFALAILILAVFQVMDEGVPVLMGQAAIAVAAMVASVVLYTGRSDFTR